MDMAPDSVQTTLDAIAAKSAADAQKKKRLDTAKALMSMSADPMKQQYVDGIAVQSSPLEALSKLGTAAAGAYITKKNQTAPSPKGTQPPAPKVS